MQAAGRSGMHGRVDWMRNSRTRNSTTRFRIVERLMCNAANFGVIAGEKPPVISESRHANMRTRYLVCYDICHPKRLRNVAKACESFGSRIQFSVFECPLDELRFEKMKAALSEIIHHEEDQILFVSLGPESSKNPFRIEKLNPF